MSARKVAYELLRAVDQADAYANLALPALLSRSGLDARDRAFATELGYGTLRLRGRYEALLAHLSGRSRIDAPVRRVVALGMHQLLEMRVSAHAAVSQTVALTNQVRLASAKGFVNAILRKVASHDRGYWLAVAEELSAEARFAHPAWIIEQFAQSLQWARIGDELTALLEADNQAPSPTLVSLPGLGPAPSELGAAGMISPLAAKSVVLDRLGLPVGVRVQDEGSQLAALALARCRSSKTGERWLDMCAGPGGKAALLATLAHQHGAVLTANDASSHRAELVRRALAELGPIGERVIVTQQDGRELTGQFERILVDVPCSGLGALRRRPEARWKKSYADAHELSKLQHALLAKAIALAAPGGIIGYVTCSPDLRETRDVARHALEQFPVRLLDADQVVNEIAGRDLAAGVAVTETGPTHAVQLWPHRHASDAMYIALLEKLG